MIKLDNISLGYRGHTLLREFSCTLAPATLTALVGRNGTGKSTLLRTIAGLQPPLNGHILLNGRDLATFTPAARAQMVALVSTTRVRVPALRCREVVALGRAPYTPWNGRLTPEDLSLIDDALSRVGMPDFAHRLLSELSDGECQRIFIARAIAQQTPILLLDEPTAFLDVPSRHEIGGLLHTLAHDEHKTILFSTHDMDIVREFANASLTL